MRTFRLWTRGFQLGWIGGVQPNQATGMIDGYPFHFRAKHGYWRLTRASHAGQSIERWVPIAEGWHEWAGHFNAAEARALIMQALDR